MNPNLENCKKPIKYFCDFCNFNTCNKKDYSRHISTYKHIILTNPTIKTPKNPFFNCICGNLYKHSSSLCAHKKKCKYENISSNVDDTNITLNVQNDVSDKEDLISYLIKENQEFKNLILEIVKKDTYQSNTTNNNSHNKTFNLQFFLNETCKDAMNIMEFVDSIKLQLSDLENVGQVGYVEGISNIIVKNLNALDINKRPVHCTDKKREVLYVKDENKWEKENDDKKKIRKMIKYIASKNQRMLPKFKEAHPDCNKSISRFSDKYNKILVESMGGSGDNDLEKEDKIIRNISKNIIVNK